MSKRDDVPILEIENLGLSYFVRAGEIPAVIDFSLKVYPGESVGLVGESGCGKSTVANGIMRYMGANGDIVAGRIKFKGRDMAEMSEDEIRRLRGKDIAMIYQEPMAALNPSLTVASQLMEVPIYHENVSENEARSRAIEMLDEFHRWITCIQSISREEIMLLCAIANDQNDSVSIFIRAAVC